MPVKQFGMHRTAPHALLMRIGALLLACALLAASVAACGGKSKKGFVMHSFSTFGAEEDLAAYSEVMSQFTKQHKHVTVNDTTTTQANSYKMALSIASTYKGSSAPDVIYFSAMPDMGELSDFFMTVDDIRKDYPHFADSVSEAVLNKAAANDGGRYCIPIRGQWQGIIVNAAMFRKSGLNIPQSWSDILRAANHFKKGNVSLFANSLEDSSALMEYMVRGLGGTASLQSAFSGSPDAAWQRALEAILQLDELSAFPSMQHAAYDDLVSSADLQHTAADSLPSAVELYNSEKAAILLIDNTMCGQINADIDSQYIMLPAVGSASETGFTTAASGYPTNHGSGPVYPRITANTLPAKEPSSGSGETQTPPAAQETTAPTAENTTDGSSQETETENGLYVNFAEGFYITKRAYYDPDKREDILDFVECFLQEENCIRFCAQSRVPSLARMTKETEDTLTNKANIYHAVIASVQAADSFVTTTQTQENKFFWSHCSLAVACMSKGILTKEEALRMMADTQLTPADVYHQQ